MGVRYVGVIRLYLFVLYLLSIKSMSSNMSYICMYGMETSTKTTLYIVFLMMYHKCMFVDSLIEYICPPDC
jgi:hypothetical protein